MGAAELFHRLVDLRDRGHLAEQIRADLLAERALVNERLLSLHLSLKLLVLPRENDADESQAKKSRRQRFTFWRINRFHRSGKCVLPPPDYTRARRASIRPVRPFSTR